MKTRTDLLNHLVEKYQLKRYLEIGVQVPESNFSKIKCDYKVGIDPNPTARAIFTKTSDEYFRAVDAFRNKSCCLASTTCEYDPYGFCICRDDYSGRHFGPFDLVFIDGLHTAEQVRKDFENALKVLSPNGFIVLHDCNPEKEERTIVPRPTPTGHWHGDVYRFAAMLGGVHDCFWTVDIDCGCGVWRNDAGELYDPVAGYPIFWKYFNENRKELLNIISWEEFIKL